MSTHAKKRVKSKTSLEPSYSIPKDWTVVAIFNNAVCLRERNTGSQVDVLSFSATVNREYVLLPKDANGNEIPKSQIRSFDGYAQSIIVNETDFSGHFNDEFIIRMWMKHANDDENSDKHHIFCKSDEKCKSTRRKGRL